VLRAVDGGKFKMGYKLTDATLKLSAPTAQGEREEGFKGKLALTDMTATIGLGIHTIRSDLDFSTSYLRKAKKSKIALTYRSPVTFVHDRMITDLFLDAATDPVTGVLAMTQLRGAMYGGQLVGNGAVDPAQGGKYRININLQDVGKDQFVDPAKPAATTQPDSQRSTISGGLVLEGLPDNVQSRRGRGSIEMRHANMYEVPFVLAMLRILNFAFPNTGGFDRASATFIVDGDMVDFDSIRMEASSLGLVGRGTMKTSTQEIDMLFLTTNPNVTYGGFISELLGGLKNQLIQIHIGGTVKNPKTDVRSLPVLTNSIDAVLGNFVHEGNHEPLAPTSRPPATSGQ
jgi:hypothetical protein